METLDLGTQMARQIIKQSWLDEGMTEEEWEQNRVNEEVLHGLTGQGFSWDEANAYLDKATWEEIVRKHHELFPQRYETK